MLEYFAVKKFKQFKADKEAEKQAAHPGKARTTGDKTQAPEIETVVDNKQHENLQCHSQSDSETSRRRSSDHTPLSPVLDKSDEAWLRSILEDDGPPPPLPPRIRTPEIEISDSDSVLSNKKSLEIASLGKDKGKGKEKEDGKGKKKEKNDKKDDDEKHPSRFSLLFHRNKKHGDTLKPEDITAEEAEREKDDLGNVLDRLNLQAKNNKIISLSNESSDLLQRFTNIFKDLVNGVPTACNDLTKLFDDRDGAINRGFEKLPSSLQKLVTQLPEKLTTSLAPELLAAAAESQGLKAEAAELGAKEAAKKLFMPQNLAELVTKPGAIVSMLKAIVNALKLRWPAVMGTNVVWSVALFLLMFVLWYCHKRGREVRLEKEKADAETPIDGSDRIEELPDDPLLPAPEPASTRGLQGLTRATTEPVSPLADLPPPPVGQKTVLEPSGR
ncbi:hypothetical protein B0J13DRAFT_540919 [Dactylonectria estremocensis]|uniref:Ring-like domain-containing protein n=1 Tax=Dactylonectria estremocensis TaxID=1079267 RepID=A0A9P9FFU0_9HYPO|nr:hypothetical protein B0J13DRAFT_540919 [Dactylonectria estremocensis]